MRRLILVGFASLVALAPVGAGAVTLTHTPVGTPICLSASAPTACNGGIASVPDYDFSFNISVDPSQIITDALLTLNLFDDFGQADGSEKLTLHLDDDLEPTSGDVQNDLGLTLNLSLLDDNVLSVSLGVDGTRGDYFFGWATLDLTLADRLDSVNELVPTDSTTSAVPLPTPLVLLGLGLVTLAARRRR
jgi:MYXO-CTERM domain-containing protein